MKNCYMLEEIERILTGQGENNSITTSPIDHPSPLSQQPKPYSGDDLMRQVEMENRFRQMNFDQNSAFCSPARSEFTNYNTDNNLQWSQRHFPVNFY